MKNGWPKKTLGEICGFVRGPFGGSLKKSVFVADGFAVYEQQHAIYDQFDDIRYFIDDAKFQEMQRFELRPNDLIMSCSGTMGRVAIVPDNIRRGIINQALLKLTPSKTVSPEFLKYWMDSGDFQDSLKEQSGGAAIQNVASVGILKEIQILLPPFDEQERIVGLLDEAFAGLATAKANAEKNLQNARALFESQLQSVFTQRGKGWDNNQLDALTEPDAPITYGVVKPGDEGEVKFVRGGDLVRGKVRLSQLRTITRAVSDQYRRTLLRGGELLICLVGQPGQVAVAPKELAGANIARQVGLIRLKKMIDAEFVRYFLQSASGAVALGARESGSVQQVINLGELRHLSVPYPELSHQREIVARLTTMEAETQRLATIYERKLAALEALKKSLLHQAFTGELG